MGIARAIRIAPFVVVALLFAAIDPYANVVLPPRTLPLTELLLGGSPVANVAACALLAALYFVKPRKSIVALVGIFALAAIVSLGRFILLPLALLGGPMPLQVGPNDLGWMMLAFHYAVSVGAIGYALLRRTPRDATGSSGPILAIVSLALVGTVAVIVALPIVSEALPHLIRTTDITLLRSSGFGWAVLALMIVALVSVTLVERDAVDFSFSLALMAMCAEVGFLIVSNNRFTIGWFMAELSSFWSALFVPIGVAWQLFDSSRRLNATQTSLAHHEHRSLEYAGRLAALWRASNDAALSVADRLEAILREGGQSLRVDGDFEGFLCRLHGDAFEAIAFYRDGGASLSHLPFGPREALFLAQLRDGVTRMWSDVLFAPELNELAGVRERGWRSIVATMVSIAAVPYVVVFASARPVVPPFDENDREFADVLATLIATQLHQQSQVESMAYQAEHDVLTGLRNRGAFRSSVVAAIASGRCAVAIGDLSDLAEITRSLGVLASDAVLVEAGAALERGLREGDVLARIGDTQFGILLPAPAGTSDIARRVGLYTRAIDRPFSLGHRSTDVTLDVSACFGVAQFPGDGDDADSIIAHAAAACDVARGRGRRAVVFFDPLLERDHQLRRTAVAELRQAIAERQFVIYYQPIIDLATDRVVGAESLVRWNHPTRGIVLPGTFLPLASEAGLISEIDALVARTSIGDIPALAGGDPAFRLYINLVADRMKADDIVATLLALLRDFGVAPTSFGVEITETTAMNDVMQNRIILERFRREGISVALDDFGTGFSSLSYLKTFPIDVLKIDRSFIEGLPDDRNDAALVESIAAIAKIFGFSLHAEGVQNERQREWLRARGCETMQGFAYGEPMPRAAFLAWRDARRLAAAAP